ncbi:glycosyltransferase [Paenibacillus sp. FSL M7-0420]|uniref:glycosyltransferase n=1 Tax=Paenibacillus sp. FSL M7-0420 TaxID=2921609 RepID=UPI0030F6C717
MEKVKTFLFTLSWMEIGGIQTYLIRTIKQLKKNGNRIIWLFPVDGYIDDSFKGSLLNGEIEIVNVDFEKINWINSFDLIFKDDEEVVALAFDLINFTFLELMKRKYSKITINSFFWVPHFEGPGVFIEESLNTKTQRVAKKVVGKIIRKMERNNNIFYVNKSHLNAMTRNYKYKVTNKEDKVLVGYSREVLPFDNSLALKRSERDVFNIITVGRFSFPHKEYIIGLLHSYEKLKEKYSHLKLTIIGHGEDEAKVIQEIKLLSSNAQKDIELIGKVEYENLNKHFEKANIFIGVAGSIVDSAINGLISIPVRHYCKICEGYGFLPESKEYLTSSEPGIPIEVFIEETINMDTQSYLKLSEDTYNTFSSESITKSTERLLMLKNVDYRSVIPSWFITLIGLTYSLKMNIKKRKMKTRR